MASPQIRSAVVETLFLFGALAAWLAVPGFAEPPFGTAAGIGPFLEEIEIPSDPECYQFLSSLASYNDGSFAVAWTQDWRPLFTQEAQIRFFAPGGQPMTDSLSLSNHPEADQVEPSIAALANGDLIAAWTSFPKELGAPPRDGSASGIFARRLGPDGTFLGDDFQVNATASGAQVASTVAALPDGGFVVLWFTHQGPSTPKASLRFQQFDSAASPVGLEREIFPDLPLSREQDTRDLAVSKEGTFAVVVSSFVSGEGGTVHLQFFTLEGQPLGDRLQLSAPQGEYRPSPHIAALEDGRFAVAWNESKRVLVRFFSAQGVAEGPAVQLQTPGLRGAISPNLVADRQGGFFVLASEDSQDAPTGRYSSEVYAQRYTAAASPFGARIRLNRFTELDQWLPLGFVDPSDGLMAVWQSQAEPSLLDPPLLSCAASPSQDGSGHGIYARRVLRSCDDEKLLCLRDNRFGIEVEYRDPYNQRSGVGFKQELTEDTGAFWFFNPDNLEVAVKVLDGTTLNGHFWVFYGSMTSVQFTLRVTDFETGESAEYQNPPFELASRGDTTAMPAPVSTPTTVALPSKLSPPVPLPPASPPLLLRDRFRVSVRWHDPFNQRSGIGEPLTITDDTGAFWFFGPDNVELMVKVLDGRPINGHFWVFYASLTNVEFSLYVEDLETGATQFYSNPAFLFASGADTTAF